MFENGLTEQEAYQIGMETYIYTYPLVTMDVTRRQATNVEAGKTVGRGPVNTFTHIRAYPTAEFRDVVRPNFDTLYSIAWLDLTKEPMVVSVPDTEGRYYLLPMYDMWSDAFAVPGTRTSGTKAASYAVVPPDWAGTLPPNVERINAPTPFVWIIARTQTNGPKDYEAVHKVQDGYTITPLSRLGINPATTGKVEIDPTVDMKTAPLDQVNKMPAADYFKYAAKLMAVNPAHETDWSTIARMRRIGLEVGKPFDIEKLPPAIRAALDRSAVDGLKAMHAKIPTMARTVNGWQMSTDTIGVYGNNYLKRAISIDDLAGGQSSRIKKNPPWGQTAIARSSFYCVRKSGSSNRLQLSEGYNERRNDDGQIRCHKAKRRSRQMSRRHNQSKASVSPSGIFPTSLFGGRWPL